MKKLKNIHPGEILLKEFLEPLEISCYRLAKDLGIPQTRVSSIVNGTRRITADTALRLSLYFGNSPKFWLSLQDDFDIEEELRLKKKDFGQVIKFDIRKKNITTDQRTKTLFPKKLEKANKLLRRVGVPEVPITK
jgi:addiction module HigA family antidote